MVSPKFRTIILEFVQSWALSGHRVILGLLSSLVAVIISYVTFMWELLPCSENKMKAFISVVSQFIRCCIKSTTNDLCQENSQGRHVLSLRHMVGYDSFWPRLDGHPWCSSLRDRLELGKPPCSM